MIRIAKKYLLPFLMFFAFVILLVGCQSDTQVQANENAYTLEKPFWLRADKVPSTTTVKVSWSSYCGASYFEVYSGLENYATNYAG